MGLAVGAASPRTASCRRRVRPLHLECWTSRRSSADHRVDPDVARAGAGACSAACQGAAATEVADAEDHGAKEAASSNRGAARCLDSGSVRTERRVAPGPGSTEEGQDPSPQGPSKIAGSTPAKGAGSQVDAASDARSVRQFPQPGRPEVDQLIRRQLSRAHPRFGDRDRLLLVCLDSGKSPPVAPRRVFQIGATGRHDADRACSPRDDLHALPHDQGLDAAKEATVPYFRVRPASESSTLPSAFSIFSTSTSIGSPRRYVRPPRRPAIAVPRSLSSK
jgi:hypothetical protein